MSEWNINGSNLTKKQKKELDQELIARGIDIAGLVTGAKLYLARYDLKQIPMCSGCGKSLSYHAPSCSYRKYCSAKCSANSSSTIDRRRATNLNKYGTINVLTKDADKRRTEQFNLYYSNFERFKTKVVPAFNIEDFKGKCSTTEYKWCCVRCNEHFDKIFLPGVQAWPKCPKCDSSFTDIEEQVLAFLQRYDIETRVHYRKILQGFELDFFIPKLQLAIETNGLFYHTEWFFPDKNYHKNKTDSCSSKNIKLIQIFSDELYFVPKAALGRLRSILGLNRKINGRSCRIEAVSAKLACKFLNKYHTQGADKSSIRYGLYYKNRLVSVMTFCKLRKVLGQTSTEGSWELSRFVCINGFSIRGGFQKLLNRFIKDTCPKVLISYCDKRWTPNPMQSVYASAGFKYIHTSEPNYWYVGKSQKRQHRANFQKHMLLAKYPQFDKTFSEKQIMKELGYYRIWDCGHHKFQMTFDVDATSNCK
jgi:hypothetical protein